MVAIFHLAAANISFISSCCVKHFVLVISTAPATDKASKLVKHYITYRLRNYNQQMAALFLVQCINALPGLQGVS